MPVNFNDSFWTENNRNLQRPTLNCLVQDAALYKTSLLQLSSELGWDNSGIWHLDNDIAKSKVKNFFSISKAENVDLAITPEYSCPWEVLQELLVEDIYPNEQQIWISGMTSINPIKLVEFIENHTEVIWITDDKLIQNNISNDSFFFDPVCLILNTQTVTGEVVKTIIVQFKTKYFGGNGFEWEQENLIRGNTFYLISNRISGITLCTLICSDTLNPDFNLKSINHYVNIPFLFIHIQLNQKPNKDIYKAYRNQIFESAFNNKDVICLNWARGVIIDKTNWNKYGGSAIYTKSDKINTSDQRLDDNHKLGLIYTNWAGKRTNVYFLNFDEYLFIFNNTKSSQLADSAVQQKRTGPKGLKLLKWESNSEWVEVIECNDGFRSFCEQTIQEYGELNCLIENSKKIDVERMISISASGEKLESDWFLVHKLTQMEIMDHEINKRINFTHDPDEAINEERLRKLEHYAILKHQILKNEQLPLPKRFQKPRLKFDYNLDLPNRYLVNLHCDISSNKGTIIFLGASSSTRSKLIKDKVTGLFKINHSGKHVFVYYYNNGMLAYETNSDLTPEITENLGKTRVSITRTGGKKQ